MQFFFSALYLSMNDPERAGSSDFEVTNKFTQVREFTDMESMNNKDCLYLQCLTGQSYNIILCYPTMHELPQYCVIFKFFK